MFEAVPPEEETGLNYEESLMVKAAWYYYFENMTQQAIADRLSISRMRVIKLLETARQTVVTAAGWAASPPDCSSLEGAPPGTGAPFPAAAQATSRQMEK